MSANWFKIHCWTRHSQRHWDFRWLAWRSEEWTRMPLSLLMDVHTNFVKVLWFVCPWLVSIRILRYTRIQKNTSPLDSFKCIPRVEKIIRRSRRHFSVKTESLFVAHLLFGAEDILWYAVSIGLFANMVVYWQEICCWRNHSLCIFDPSSIWDSECGWKRSCSSKDTANQQIRIRSRIPRWSMDCPHQISSVNVDNRFDVVCALIR